jgi:hypothetical protein
VPDIDGSHPGGPQKANVAIQHSNLIAMWHMANTGALYDDHGADHFTRITPSEPPPEPSANSKPWEYRVTLDTAS